MPRSQSLWRKVHDVHAKRASAAPAPGQLPKMTTVEADQSTQTELVRQLQEDSEARRHLGDKTLKLHHGWVEVAPRASHYTSQEPSGTMYDWPHLSSFDNWTNLMEPRIKSLQALLTSYEK